jgi:heme/copper-type cytochrome/quinol oxidase subunit 2
MQYALGVMGDQAIMIGITFALGLAGLLGLAMALFWPRRWHLPYRAEIAFIVILAGLVIYADRNSAQTYAAYETAFAAASAVPAQSSENQAGNFDRRISVYAFQWGFLFFDESGAASRNAVKVAPGAKVLFSIAANDVIHGFNIPAARLTTELEPHKVQTVWIKAPDAPGKYLIQCLNFCGLGHAQMKAWLVVGDDAPAASPDRPGMPEMPGMPGLKKPADPAAPEHGTPGQGHG